MRIDSHLHVPRVQGVRSKGIDPLSGVQATDADSLEISGRAEDFRVALDALKEVPEVREDKVAELRAQLEQGNLDLNLDALAEKLLP